MTPLPGSRQSAEPATVIVQLRLSQDLADRIEAYRQTMLIRPSLSATLRALITDGLSTLEGGGQ